MQESAPEPVSTSWQPSVALLKLRADHQASVPALGAERAIHYTEFYKANRISSPALRKARALADHLARRSIRIHPGEVIVGSHTEHRIGAICFAELAGVAMLEDIFRFPSRRTDPLHIDPAARRKLLFSVIPYWLSKNLAAQAFPLLKRLAYFRDQLAGKRFIITEAGGVAHFLPNYADLIGQGTEGLRTRIAKVMNRQPAWPKENRDQLEANLIALEALEAFADRYRKLAAELGRQDIVEVLDVVPRKPAATLRQALQMIWLFQMIIQIESLDQGISLGRLDQYLYPLYKKEVSDGSFDADGIAGDLGEEAFHLVQPGSRGRREVEMEARVLFQPLLDLSVLVGGVGGLNEERPLSALGPGWVETPRLIRCVFGRCSSVACLRKLVQSAG